MTLVFDDQVTESDLLAELAREYDAEQRQPGDITVAQFARYKGIGIERARKWLDAKAEQGEILKVNLSPQRVVYRRT